MSRRALSLVALAAAAAVAGLASCGGGGKTTSTGAPATPVAGQKRGGALKVVSTTDVDHIDPGQSYYQFTYQITYATNRPLLSYRPENPRTPVPDLAAAQPQVSSDGRALTIRIRPNVRFSPPVNRTVTSRDVKYAIERGMFPNIRNGYSESYFGKLVGARAVIAGRSRDIPGLQTPDDTTLVMRFSAPTAALAAQALVLPTTAPVPVEYATRLDRASPSGYGMHQVATGPYMIANDRAGIVTGYQPGRRILLVRNPNWNRAQQGDYRPAYLDRIEFAIGGDPTVLGRQVLQGRGLVNGDTIPAPIVKLAAQRRPRQITYTPLGGRYVPLNTAIAPFDDANLRKAVAAAMDRTRMALTRGGRLVGEIADHILPPTAPGFDAAGGREPPKLDFLAHPRGDMQVARRYMRAAGYPGGRYTGPAITMVADNSEPASKTAQVVLDALRRLGFRVNVRSLTTDAMYTAFCNVPRRRIQVCPNVSWVPDFNGGYAYLYVPFSGSAISPVNNSNWPQLDDPGINAALERAAATVDPRRRAQAWARVDRMITGTAAAIPWLWDRVANIESSDVQGVIAQWNASWDVSFTSLR